MPGTSSVEIGLGDRTEGTAEGAEPVEMDLNTGTERSGELCPQVAKDTPYKKRETHRKPERRVVHRPKRHCSM